MAVTIKEIAEMAGVHRSTVDKVLHNRPGVSDPVRKRIQKIIDECHYEINPIGKALQMQDRNFLIKAILLEVDALPLLKDGIHEALKNYHPFHITIDYTVVRFTDIPGQRDALCSAITEKADMVILSPINAPEIAEELHRLSADGIPVITLNTDLQIADRMCFIGQNSYKAGQIAGRLMGEFLGSQGKVAIFTSDTDAYDTFPFGTRKGGFQAVMGNLFPKIELLPCIQTEEKASVIYQQTLDLIKTEKELRGIFITCGGAHIIGSILKEQDIHTIKVICYENYASILELLQQGFITATLDSDIKYQGHKALATAMEYLIYAKRPTQKRLYTETKILLRESL